MKHINWTPLGIGSFGGERFTDGLATKNKYKISILEGSAYGPIHYIVGPPDAVTILYEGSLVACLQRAEWIEMCPDAENQIPPCDELPLPEWGEQF